ncbi:M protein trans-acting positive regulator PRD domain-containing protein [Streptococcus halichoeri]|uniref:M protein trans-acting positive regulator PRD domain-containing protein n=1 Tax=Streptococcus halichoeri TaxID=254785 RepID=UPI00135C9A1C|nr:M protein trans-acting positive regulator PRD domain-containing protein [Streptococcus halichoeri]
MLENRYIEQTIRDKAHLVMLFFNRPSISLQEVKEIIGLTSLQVRQYCKELDLLYSGRLNITLKKGHIQVDLIEPAALETFLYPLYRQSGILQLLRFFIINPIKNGKSLAHFAKEQFISTASAYRLREAIVPYIEEIGLRLMKNSIVGEEYRMRYLIAFLQTKFGIDIYELTPKDQLITRHFLFDSASHLRPSHLLSESFIFYNVLLSLSWKRHDKSVRIPESAIFNKLTRIFIYEELAKSIEEILQPQTGLTFQKDDLDYLFLIYLTASNSFASQKWSKEHIQQVRAIFEADPAFSQLLRAIQKLSPLFLDKNDDLVHILIYFYLYFLFDLQDLIPEQVRCSSRTYQGHAGFFQAVNQVVNQWLRAIGAKGPHCQHLFLLCNHLEQLLRNCQPPIKLVCIAANAVNARLLKDAISALFSPKSVAVHSFYLLIDDIYKISDLEPDLVITHQKLIPFVKKELTPNVAILDFSSPDFNGRVSQLQKRILDLKEEKYEKIMTEQFATSATQEPDV